MNDCILLLSGGIDSTVTLAELVAAGRKPICLIFDYGQTLRTELLAAVENVEGHELPYYMVEFDMSWLAPGCTIFGPKAGDLSMDRSLEEIANTGTPESYVPFRNGIMLSIAAAYAEGHAINDIYCGGNGLDSGNYWDDTKEFALAMEQAINVGTDPEWNGVVIFPNAQRTKAEVVALGLKLGVNFRLTFSCYTDGIKHCGKCDSCKQREAAFAVNGLDLVGREK